MNMFDQQAKMQELQRDPLAMAKQAGFNIPEGLAGNPQAMVMHLINSGQVSSPVLQRIMPMIRQMTGK